MAARPLILASASPGRLSLLRAAGISPRVVVSSVPEDGVHDLAVDRAVLTLAGRKASAVAEDLRRASAGGRSGDTATGADGTGAVANGEAAPDVLVLGCDSLLAFDGEARGKPASAEIARAWWQGMRGREATLVTGQVVIDAATGRRASGVAETIVGFGAPSDAEIDAYLATGEPLQVSGAFTIDGRGAPFVERIDGSHTTVVGLSLPLLRRLLADLGIAITDLWDDP